MNAYLISDDELWAANSLEEAIADYKHETGETVDPKNVCELTDKALDEEIPEYDENECLTGNMTTIRSWLAEMAAPGFLGSLF